MSHFRLIAFAALLLAAAPAAAMAEPAPASVEPADAPAGAYALDRAHASLIAKVSHMGLSYYTMRFDSFDAHYDYDPGNPLTSKVTVTIDANSLDVGDARLGKAFAREFLGADQHPQIVFAASGVQPTTPGHGVLTGDLSLNGVTRPVSLDVTFNGTSPAFMGIGGHRMGFSAVGDIKRSDFGLNAWKSVVGDNVRLLIEAEFAHR